MQTTLFMLISVDGKISTGAADERDFDKDFPNISGVSEGLSQYYKLEAETDVFSFNTGRVLAKVGWNDTKTNISKIPASFVIVDNKPHLTKVGVENLLKRCMSLIVATTNSRHPALSMKDSNLVVMHSELEIDFVELFEKLEKMGIKQMTIQSGGDMNSTLLRRGLITNLSIVVAPALIGGKETPSLIGGDSLLTKEDLKHIKTLELTKIDKLENNYLHLLYKVL